jgi:hypothetical protein
MQSSLSINPDTICSVPGTIGWAMTRASGPTAWTALA